MLCLQQIYAIQPFLSYPFSVEILATIQSCRWQQIRDHGGMNFCLTKYCLDAEIYFEINCLDENSWFRSDNFSFSLSKKSELLSKTIFCWAKTRAPRPLTKAEL